MRFQFNNIFLKVALLSVIFCCSFYTQAHGNHNNNYNDVELAKEVFEKALILSPQIMDAAQNSATTPYIKVGSEKIYLNSHFWQLVSAWIRVYKTELQKECECNFTAEEVVQEAQRYKAEGVFLVGAKKMGEWSATGSYLTSKYGYVATILKVSAEVAETVLSVFVGGKGIHIICNAIDVMIFPFAKFEQSFMNQYSYGRNMGQSGLYSAFKTSWISFKIFRARKKVFFEINEMAQLTSDHQIHHIDSLGLKKGKRQAWIRKLENLRERLSNTDSKQIQRKIEKASAIKQKKFFGSRYKRFLLLFSRKYSSQYMVGKDANSIFKNRQSFPFLITEDILEPAFKVSNAQSTEIQTDEIKENLISEFLNKIDIKKDDKQTMKKDMHIFFKDIDTIFDTSISIKRRHVVAGNVGIYLGTFLDYYLKLSMEDFRKKQKITFFENLKIYSLRGKLSREVNSYVDFLLTVASSNNSDTISLYKYESMETLLLFLAYFHNMKSSSKQVSTFIKTFNTHLEEIKIMSLGRQKRAKLFSIKAPMCSKLVGLK